jgi:hypothetical protein
MNLTNKNIKTGLTIENIAHPEWGKFTITQDRNGYNYKSNKGEAILSPLEYKFWRII